MDAGYDATIHTCYTILGLVHGTLMPELSESDQERGKLSIVSSLFGLLGTLIRLPGARFFPPQSRLCRCFHVITADVHDRGGNHRCIFDHPGIIQH